MSQTIEPPYHLNLGDFTIPITTHSTEAQIWFNRAWIMMAGFNHEEAIRLFDIVLQLDPDCAMAYWGIACSLLGNYNNAIGLDPVRAEACVERGVCLVEKGGYTDKERGLLIALRARFPRGDDGDPVRAYVDEMKLVYDQYPDDTEVMFAYAEAMMNLSPWKLWTNRYLGEIKPQIPETLEIMSVLEKGLSINPRHPGLCHLYIHCMELSPTPEKALETANILRNLVPEQGHLLHMPSHIDMWVGNYQNAIDSNINGVMADEKYCRVTGNYENIYKFYRMHNYHFIVWAAMIDGQYETGLKYANLMLEQLTEEHMKLKMNGIDYGTHYLESYSCIKWHLLVRFGKWNEILEVPIPENQDIFAGHVATSRYARGVAYAAMGMVENAEAERELFYRALENPELHGREHSNNIMYQPDSTCNILSVAQQILEGEIEYRKGNFEVAFDHLREAVRRDQSLVYDEPWGWMMPARHPLGALLTEQGYFEEAKRVYEEDLLQYPNNLWSLGGLLNCLKGLNADPAQIEDIQKRKQTAEHRSKTSFKSSCLCATKTL
eukprot:TRINITY_DN3844_c0_g1_i1.p1 TRINITY_DN3844_c0_g1~~TRINITY_DN3844_c0_g1_i1.p1  ORF type:complete len:563 (-),score=93.76 TRINITY_DN3844_c0_g1_i1:83-1729(-)